MCYYRYVYYSRCQHAELYKYTYCNDAIALGQPQRDADKFDMSTTITSSEAGRKLPESPHRVRLPLADLVPRSVHHEAPLNTPSYRNINIDIPLDTQSSVSMELTHNGKVMELVARFEACSDCEGSDASKADGDRTRASSAATVRPFEETTSIAAEAESPTPPRKSIPAQWRTTPRGPILMTQMRGEEREKRRSAGQGSSPVSPPTVHGSTSGSPLRKSKSTVKITVSSTRNSLPNDAFSVVSTDDSVFHSARHSPVSQNADPAQSSACSTTSFVTANELHDGDSHYALSEADGMQKLAVSTVSSSLSPSSLVPHVKASVAGKKATTTRPAAPKLSLRIPPTTSLTDRKPPFVLGSASSSGSGLASPLRSSRIPRATPMDGTATATSTKRTQARLCVAGKSMTLSTVSKGTVGRKAAIAAKPHDVPLPETPIAVPIRHVRTLNSTGATPIISQVDLDKNAMVASYLETVEPVPTSESTARAIPIVDDPVLQDTAVLSCRKKPDASGMTTESLPVASPVRGRSTNYVPHDRKQTRSELSATAPEFVPQVEAGVPSQQMITDFSFDPFGVDMYGIPWYFHMYPVPIQGPFAKSPKKRRTFPYGHHGRKRGGSSPTKNCQPALVAPGPEAGNSAVPFSAQLEEIARHAAARHGKVSQGSLGSNFQTTPTRHRPIREARNGLYDTVGHGRGRQAGMPIEATTPFPTPVPPSGRRDYVGYTIVKREPTCGVINIERAAEWGGGVCNECEPDH